MAVKGLRTEYIMSKTNKFFLQKNKILENKYEINFLLDHTGL